MTVTPDIEEEALGWFVRLRDPDATVDSWLAFQDWLERDPAHAAAYEAVECAWIDADVAAAPVIPLPVAANDRGVGRRHLVSAFAAAAAVVLCFGVWTQVGGPTQVRTYAAGDAPRVVTLSDGSRVHLNRHSEMTVRMRRTSRQVSLDGGEFAFDVAHQASRPFVISADGRQVRVLGTAFNVLDDGDHFAVSVERGVVSVTPRGDGGPVRLTVGQRVDQTGATALVVSRIDPRRASSWREGVLIYRDAPLVQVADDLSRYLDKPVTVSLSAQALRFTGALRIGDEATMLKQLQDFTSVQTTRSSTGIVLTARGDL